MTTPTPTQAAPTAAPVTSRITIDDVRTAIAGTNPNHTNAGKVRALLGNRGSFETIQKHLGTLRAELAAAAAPPVTAAQVPALPAEAAQAMWFAAWTAAQVQTLRRTETLATERDAALLELETMGQDVAGLVATVDEQTANFEERNEMLRGEIFALNQTIEHMDDEVQSEARNYMELKDEMVKTCAELAKTQSDAAHAAELAESGRQMMREELARLTDQVGELKAHLYRRAEAAPAPAAPAAPAK